MKTAISNFVASSEPTVRSLNVLYNHFFGLLSSSHLFYLTGAPEVSVSDYRDDAVILRHERDSYRKNVLHIRALNFLLQKINLLLHQIGANYFKEIFI